MGPWSFEGSKSIKNRALIRHTTFKKRYLHEKTRRQTERNLFPSSISRGPGAEVCRRQLDNYKVSEQAYV